MKTELRYLEAREASRGLTLAEYARLVTLRLALMKGKSKGK